MHSRLRYSCSDREQMLFGSAQLLIKPFWWHLNCPRFWDHQRLCWLPQYFETADNVCWF